MNVLSAILLPTITSVVTTAIQNYFLKRGKLRIFYKVENIIPDGKSGYGIIENSLLIPLTFDLQNTSGVNKVCRDVSLWLCKDSNKLIKLQSTKHIYQRDGKTNEIINEVKFGNDSNIYSFVIEPKSIKTVRCFFIIDKAMIDKRANNVSLSYYDENNSIHLYKLFDDNAAFKEIIMSDIDWKEARN